jgi:PAS domain S-box-containing protein
MQFRPAGNIKQEVALEDFERILGRWDFQMQNGATRGDYLLATLPAAATHERRALGMLIVSTVVFLALLPFAKHPLPAIRGFIPLYQSALIVNDIITAILLFGHLHSQRSRRMAILAFGYLFTALIVIVHMLSFPGMFAPAALLGAGPQTTAWIYMFWHAGLPLFVIAYAGPQDRPAARSFLIAGAAAVVLLVAALTLVATVAEYALPVLVEGNRYAQAYFITSLCVWAVSPIALFALKRKTPRSVLDLWLAVVMVVWIFDIALSALLNSGRFDLGFYAGSIYGLLASAFVLYLLLLENNGLHSKLYASAMEVAASREREAGHRLIEAVLRQLPQAVIVLDGQGICLMANDQATRIMVSIGETLEYANKDGNGTKARFSGKHLQLPLQRALAGETFFNEEINVAVGTDVRTLSTCGCSVRGTDSEPVVSVLVLDDVTKQKAADAELRRTLAQTQYLVGNAPLAVIEWDGDLIIKFWNKRAEEIFGWTAAEVAGKRLDSLSTMTQDEGHRAADVMQRLQDPDTKYVFSNNRNRRKDGRIVHTEWYNAVLRDDDGAVMTVFSLVLDVTERVQLLEQLRETDRRKDEYIATLAHELRNPIAPIHNAAALMRMKQLSPDRVEWIADVIDRQLILMSRLLDDLLDISRIARGKIELQKRRVDLAVVIRDAIDTSRPLLEKANHRYQVDLPGTPVYVEADAIRLAQVFTNLINNAAKYTEPGGHIKIVVAQEETQARVTIADNGIGIEPEIREHLFKAFVQSRHGMHLAQGGLGIGLPLVKGLVELHGGTISVQSEGRGKGSAFSVRLPAAAAESEQPQEKPATTVPIHVIGKKILITDDDTGLVDSLAVLLRQAGAEVTVVYDGAGALAMFRQNPTDIVILDIDMPYLGGLDLGGLDLAAQLSRHNPKPYLIAVSGRVQDEDRRASLNAGFDMHLTKPMTLAKLIEVINRVG